MWQTALLQQVFWWPLALHSTLEIGLDGLSVRRLELADAKGRLQLSGTLDWSPHLAWTLLNSPKPANMKPAARLVCSGSRAVR